MDRLEACHSSSSSHLPPARIMLLHSGLNAMLERTPLIMLTCCLFLLPILWLKVYCTSIRRGKSMGDPNSDTEEVDEASAVVGDSPVNTVFLLLDYFAKIVGLQPPTSDQSLWEASGKAYLRLFPHLTFWWQMIILQYWGQHGQKKIQKPQFIACCRQLANAHYPVGTGLGNMPPVEQAITSCTSLWPAHISANPHWPRKKKSVLNLTTWFQAGLMLLNMQLVWVMFWLSSWRSCEKQ